MLLMPETPHNPVPQDLDEYDAPLGTYLRHHVIVPLAYFERLVKMAYGIPRPQPEAPPRPESPSPDRVMGKPTPTLMHELGPGWVRTGLHAPAPAPKEPSNGDRSDPPA